MKNLIDLISRFNAKNIDQKVFRLLIAVWIILAVLKRKKSDIEVPLLLLYGPPGSTKTTLARTIVRVINEDVRCDVDSPPPTENDLRLILESSDAIAFDNLDSAVPKYFPGAIARAATGSAYRRRTLYTDDEQTVFYANSSIILTMIVSDLVRADILDRSIVVNLAPIESFTSRFVFESEIRPLMKDAAKTAKEIACRVVARLGEARPLQSTDLRIADFVEIGRLIAEESENEDVVNDFMEALGCISAERERLAVDADPLLAGLVEIANDVELVGRELTGEEIFDYIAEKHGMSRGKFDQALRDPQRFGIGIRQLRDRAAGLVAVEVKRKNNGVRYVINKGRR